MDSKDSAAIRCNVEADDERKVKTHVHKTDGDDGVSLSEDGDRTSRKRQRTTYEYGQGTNKTGPEGKGSGRGTDDSEQKKGDNGQERNENGSVNNEEDQYADRKEQETEEEEERTDQKVQDSSEKENKHRENVDGHSDREAQNEHETNENVQRGGGNANEQGSTIEKRAGESLGVAIILAGNTKVGKTAIMNRYVNNIFLEQNAIDPQRGDGDLRATPTMANIGGKPVELSFIDGSGLHELKGQTIEHLMRYPRGILIVYDVRFRRSYQSLDIWLRKIKSNYCCTEVLEHCLLVGNKADTDVKDRRVSQEEARKWASDNGIKHYVEMSAKLDMNVRDAIDNLAARVLEKERGIQLGGACVCL